jgi:hypothetical protein
MGLSACLIRINFEFARVGGREDKQWTWSASKSTTYARKFTSLLIIRYGLVSVISGNDFRNQLIYNCAVPHCIYIYYPAVHGCVTMFQ